MRSEARKQSLRYKVHRGGGGDHASRLDHPRVIRQPPIRHHHHPHIYIEGMRRVMIVEGMRRVMIGFHGTFVLDEPEGMPHGSLVLASSSTRLRDINSNALHQRPTNAPERPFLLR
jgi:hypothetical protein